MSSLAYSRASARVAQWSMNLRITPGQAYFVTFLPPSSSASIAQPFSGLDTARAVGA